MKLAWYYQRLRVMGVREILHRLQERLGLRYLQRYAGRQKISPKLYALENYSFCNSTEARLPAIELFEVGIRADAELILSGDWPALGVPWCWENDASWRLAPDTGSLWPTDFFGSIPYRQGNPYGDIRIAWEPSRLQQLVSLAVLARNNAYREKAVALFEKLLQSWAQANPPYQGIHYISAMECGLRIIAVCQAADMIRQHLCQPEKVWPAVVALVDSHASLIIRRLSLYSSAGNHTIAEAAGLVYAGLLFPELESSKQWLCVGRNLLESESERQVLTDGGGIEQAFCYHLFVTDLCTLAARLLAHYGQPSVRLEKVVDTAIEFLGEILEGEHQLPNIGDADSGFALSPHLRIAIKDGRPQVGPKTYQTSGYTIIRGQDSSPRLVIFDHGPLGMEPSFGHGHSDCLSIYWREGSDLLLMDSGTYTYTGEPLWRSYFRGVTAHNTVSVDGRDQAVQQAPFMWGSAFTGKLLYANVLDKQSVFLASHDGYEAIGVRHYRAIAYDNSGGALVWDFLIDLAASDTDREISLWWQFGGNVSEDMEQEGCYRLSGDNGGKLHVVAAGGHCIFRSGEEDGIQGWFSPKYGQKEPITSLEVRYTGSLPHEFLTKIIPGEKSMHASVQKKLRDLLEELRPLIK